MIINYRKKDRKKLNKKTFKQCKTYQKQIKTCQYILYIGLFPLKKEYYYAFVLTFNPWRNWVVRFFIHTLENLTKRS